MSGAFLDTTLLVHLAEPSNIDGQKATEFVDANQPAQAPYYALRELLTGRVRLLCEAHNSLLSASNPAEAMLILFRRSPAEGRKKEARLQALASIMNDAFSEKPSGDRKEIKREMLDALALQAAQLWLRAHKLKKVECVQSLACFNDGGLSYGSAGELRGPSDSFNCKESERCSAAAYLFDDQAALAKLVDALRPEKLGSGLGAKQENVQRRRALKELFQKGPSQFNKRLCRALGDAYFAVMCPAGSFVATTNLSDHDPLCNALGKQAKSP